MLNLPHLRLMRFSSIYLCVSPRRCSMKPVKGRRHMSFIRPSEIKIPSWLPGDPDNKLSGALEYDDAPVRRHDWQWQGGLATVSVTEQQFTTEFRQRFQSDHCRLLIV